MNLVSLCVCSWWWWKAKLALFDIFQIWLFIFLVSFISAFTSLFSLKKNFLTYYHRTMNFHLVFFLLLLVMFLLRLFITVTTTISTFFLIRFKDRKLHQRSVLQAYICSLFNEKIWKEKKSSLRLCLSTYKTYGMDLHTIYISSSLNLCKRLPVLLI